MPSSFGHFFNKTFNESFCKDNTIVVKLYYLVGKAPFCRRLTKDSCLIYQLLGRTLPLLLIWAKFFTANWVSLLVRALVYCSSLSWCALNKKVLWNLNILKRYLHSAKTNILYRYILHFFIHFFRLPAWIHFLTDMVSRDKSNIWIMNNSISVKTINIQQFMPIRQFETVTTPAILFFVPENWNSHSHRNDTIQTVYI